MDNKQNKCKLCDHIFCGGGTRLKAHLHGLKGKGVTVCKRSNQFLQGAFDHVSNKKAKTIASSSKQGNAQFM